MRSCSCCDSAMPCAAQISIFQQLDRESLMEISNIAVHRNVKKGEMLFSPGEQHGLYLISEGRIKVYELSPSGREFLLRVLKQGDFVGEESLFCPEESCTYGEALSDSRVCIIERREFLQLLTRHPSISLCLLEEFCRRMHQNSHQLAANAEPVGVRLAQYLLKLSAAQEKDCVVIPLPLKELASYLNTAPETLSRRLRELEERSILRREHRKITILQKDKLSSMLSL